MKLNYNNGIVIIHELWINITQLSVIMEYVISNFNLCDNNENLGELWELIIPKVNNIFDFKINQNIKNFILSNKKFDSTPQNNIWNIYELLIVDLTKLILIKDYNIVQDYDDFISEICNCLNSLKDNLEKVLFQNESPTEI